MPKARSLHERFWEKVMPEPNSGCWLWTAAESYGYGDIYEGRHKHKAHRLSYEWHKGPIPAGMHVLHKCDVPACVNPDHLFLGAHRDNMRDMAKKGRAPGGTARGERHGCAKLTAAEVIEIRSTFSGRYGEIKGLMARFNVSRVTIDRVIAGTTWKEHINGA